MPKNFINLSENAKFPFKPEHIMRLKAPIKIFGDIHG